MIAIRSRALLALLAVPAGLIACAGQPAQSTAPCRLYCATQDDGYQWAQNASLIDDAACQGYPEPFVQGCRQAVNDARLSLNPRTGF